MIDFTMLRSRISAGWDVLSLETQKLKNINHFHVTYVIGEFLLVCSMTLEKNRNLLAFCLLLHLFNILLNLDDYAKMNTAEEKRFTVKVYWGLELFIFCLGCTANWKLMLLHEVTSYLAPLFVIGVQYIFLRVFYTERNIPQAVRVSVWFLCLTVTYMPYAFLVAFILYFQGVHWTLKWLFLLFYLMIAMPLMTEFEDSECNLFEFAFGWGD